MMDGPIDRSKIRRAIALIERGEDVLDSNRWRTRDGRFRWEKEHRNTRRFRVHHAPGERRPVWLPSGEKSIYDSRR